MAKPLGKASEPVRQSPENCPSDSEIRRTFFRPRIRHFPRSSRSARLPPSPSFPCRRSHSVPDFAPTPVRAPTDAVRSGVSNGRGARGCARGTKPPDFPKEGLGGRPTSRDRSSRTSHSAVARFARSASWTATGPRRRAAPDELLTHDQPTDSGFAGRAFQTTRPDAFTSSTTPRARGRDELGKKEAAWWGGKGARRAQDELGRSRRSTGLGQPVGAERGAFFLSERRLGYPLELVGARPWPRVRHCGPSGGE